MFPRANELNMASDNGVSNSKDLKGPLTKITDSTSYPKTPYYMDKSTDRENSVTEVNDDSNNIVTAALTRI